MQAAGDAEEPAAAAAAAAAAMAAATAAAVVEGATDGRSGGLTRLVWQRDRLAVDGGDAALARMP